MTFGDSEITSRELQNDLRRAQNELRKLSRTPPSTRRSPAQPKSRSKPNPPRLCIEIDAASGQVKIHLSPQPPAPSFQL